MFQQAWIRPARMMRAKAVRDMENKSHGTAGSCGVRGEEQLRLS
jgi:hypothetical protein